MPYLRNKQINLQKCKHTDKSNNQIEQHANRQPKQADRTYTYARMHAEMQPYICTCTCVYVCSVNNLNSHRTKHFKKITKYLFATQSWK